MYSMKRTSAPARRPIQDRPEIVLVDTPDHDRGDLDGGEPGQPASAIPSSTRS
jgi:hypothetical protein